MRLRTCSIAAVLLVGMLVFPATAASAHSPLFPTGNDRLATAYTVNDPAKSWAIYSWLDEGGGVQYYRLELQQGQRISLSLLTAQNPQDGGFLPSLVLFGPSLGRNDSVPSFLDRPYGYDAWVISGQAPSEGTYEPFSATGYYQVASLVTNASQEATFYVAVFNHYTGGSYGLAVGDQEGYGPEEIVYLPYNLVRVYQWDEQDLPAILAPMAIVIAIGGILYIRSANGQKLIPSPARAFTALSALGFLGWSAMLVAEMVIASGKGPLGLDVGITLLFIILGVLLAWVDLKLVRRRDRILARGHRLLLVLVAIVGVALWSGFYIGPIAALLASVLPPYSPRSKRS